jgi:hypothetical protein
MPDILIQFHALPEELLPFVKDCVLYFNLHVVAIRHFPFEAVEINEKGLHDVFSSSSRYVELALTLKPPVLEAAHGTDFGDRNTHAMRLQIGRITNRGLAESSLSARTSDGETNRVWKEVAKRLKRITHSSALAVNPDTEAAVRDRNHRYTDGVKRLETNGITILPVAGGCVFRLGLSKGS